MGIQQPHAGYHRGIDGREVRLHPIVNPTRLLLTLSCLSLTVLAGCAEEKPKAVEAVPLTSVQQQSREIAERFDATMTEQQKANDMAAAAKDRVLLIEAIQAPLDRWGELYSALPGKQPKEVADLAARMREIRTNMEAIATNSCSFSAREKMFRGMDDIHGLIGEFGKTAPGAATDSLATRIGTAEAVVREGARDLLSCREDR